MKDKLIKFMSEISLCDLESISSMAETEVMSLLSVSTVAPETAHPVAVICSMNTIPHNFHD